MKTPFIASMLIMMLLFALSGCDIISNPDQSPIILTIDADENNEPIVSSVDGYVFDKNELVALIRLAKREGREIETRIVEQKPIPLFLYPENEFANSDVQTAPHNDQVWETLINCEKTVIRITMNNVVYKYGWTNWGSDALAGRSQWYYRNDYGGDFKRSQRSLGIEIAAHCLAARYNGYAYVPGRGWIYIPQHTNVIDMGENERFWD